MSLLKIKGETDYVRTLNHTKSSQTYLIYVLRGWIPTELGWKKYENKRLLPGELRPRSDFHRDFDAFLAAVVELLERHGREYKKEGDTDEIRESLPASRGLTEVVVEDANFRSATITRAQGEVDALVRKVFRQNYRLASGAKVTLCEKVSVEDPRWPTLFKDLVMIFRFDGKLGRHPKWKPAEGYEYAVEDRLGALLVEIRKGVRALNARGEREMWENSGKHLPPLLTRKRRPPSEEQY